jgi:hypothetical protein
VTGSFTRVARPRSAAMTRHPGRDESAQCGVLYAAVEAVSDRGCVRLSLPVDLINSHARRLNGAFGVTEGLKAGLPEKCPRYYHTVFEKTGKEL